MSRFEVTVAIPCRNARDYVNYAVRSALLGTSPETEILVSDNHSTDGSAASLRAEFESNPRVRLLQPPKPLSMTENFNFVIDQSVGSWISVIGSDDGVMPYFADSFTALIKKHPNADAFISPRAYFYWPGVERLYGNRQVLMHGRNGSKVVSSHSEFRRAFLFQLNYADTLQMYTGSVVSRRLIERVKSRDKDGVFLQSTQPDAYSSFALLAQNPSLVKARFPFHWTGSSPASNGYVHTVGDGESGRKKDFWTLAHDSDSKTAKEFDFGPSTPLMLLVMDAAIKALKVHPLSGDIRMTERNLKKSFLGAWLKSDPLDRSLVEQSAGRFGIDLKTAVVQMSFCRVRTNWHRFETIASRMYSRAWSGVFLRIDRGDTLECQNLDMASRTVVNSGFVPRP